MVRSKRDTRIGVAKALFPRLGGPPARNAARVISRTADLRYSRWRSFDEIFAIPAKALALTIDHGLVAVGVAAAIGSAAFAAFMISQNSRPAMFGGAEYARLFAAASGGPSDQSQVDAKTPYGRPIDYNVTGSISRRGIGNGARSTAASSIDVSAASARAGTSDTYVLRFVHKGVALVQSAHGFYLARRGTMLPDAGKVYSIERRGDKWILVTAKKIFEEVKNDL